MVKLLGTFPHFGQAFKKYQATFFTILTFLTHWRQNLRNAFFYVCAKNFRAHFHFRPRTSQKDLVTTKDVPNKADEEIATDEKLPWGWPLFCWAVPGVRVVLEWFGVPKSTLEAFVIGVTGLTNLDRSPGPQNIESLRSTVIFESGNRNGEGSLDDVGLNILEEATDAGDLIFASKFNCRLELK